MINKLCITFINVVFCNYKNPIRISYTNSNVYPHSFMCPETLYKNKNADSN